MKHAKFFDTNGRPCILGRTVSLVPGHSPVRRWALFFAVQLADGTVVPDYPVRSEELILAGRRAEIARMLREDMGYTPAD